MQTVREPAREIPVVAEVDVLVVGGGPAGIAAATAAARNGARTLLVERYGYLGGLATGGLVLFMSDLYDGQGERCIGGVQWEALERLRTMGGLAESGPRNLHVDSELFKIVADDLCLEAGASLRLHSWAVDALVEEGIVRGAVVESKSGRQAILAQISIDASGDGDLGAFAGAAYDLAHMRIGLNFKVGGVDLDAYRAYARQHPEEVKTLRREVQAAGGCPIGTGATPYSGAGVYWSGTRGLAARGDSPVPDDGRAGFAGTLSAIDVEDLTYAEIEMHKQIRAGIDFYRERVPGYENVRLLAIASQLGVRDSRRIEGLHRLTWDESEGNATFDDAIGWVGNEFVHVDRLQVPYRSLVPEKVEGLLIAGRCISVDDRMANPMRLIPPCMMTGQAAGTAAALAVKAGVAPRDLSVDQLRRQLVTDGAIVP
jgi:hypothetical protein